MRSRAEFVKAVKAKLPPQHTISFQGRDRLDIRRPDMTCKVFTNLKWSTADLTRVMTDPIFSQE